MKRSSTKPKMRKRWVALAVAAITDPRHSRDRTNHVPLIQVVHYLDDQGRHWEKWPSEEARLVGGPPSGRSARDASNE